ncbi:MAG: DNA polymerase IV [Akkermansiaceae bacterium]|nr:DNA polymerase IV [Akkermansiaceae bacterium]
MRKILHVDMDCFYAAIEVRDHPELEGKPVAVGGSGRRGVLTTANYVARKFGCRSAMPGFKALEACPDLIIMPVRFDVYREESRRVREIFKRFSEVIEPLSLDEAYLDISHLNSSGRAVAWEIRNMIREETGLTASAGISSNKLLSKIASDWRKPDGQFEVGEDEVADFMRELPVKRLSGVGKVMEEKLAVLGVKTCGDLQGVEKLVLAERFGKWGLELYELCRGLDERPVRTSRIRKTLSTERTLGENAESVEELWEYLQEQMKEVEEDVQAKHRERTLKSLVVKLKFADFTQTTVERAKGVIDSGVYEELLREAWSRGDGKSVRLIGAGVRFADVKEDPQMDLELE